MIDPSHGGNDKGASFGGKLVEKDITLRLARELRKELEEHEFNADRVRSCYPALVNHFERVHPYNRTAISVKHRNFRQLLGKGVFPYEYIDHADRLEETALPPIESFHSLMQYWVVSQRKF